MNGMKLGTKQRPKNSFGYENQFNDLDSDSEENENEDENNSGSYEYDSELSLQSNKNIKKPMVNPQIKLNNEKILHQQINIKQKQPVPLKHELERQKSIKQVKQLQTKLNEQPKDNKIVIQKQKQKQSQIVKQTKPLNEVKVTNEMNQVKLIKQIKQPTIPAKKTQIDKKINNLNQGMEKLNVSILQMRDGYENLKMEEKLMRNRNTKKEQEIKAYLQKKQLEKQNLLDKKKQQEEKDRQKLQESIRLQELAKANKQRQKIQENLRKLSQQKQKRQFEKLKMAQQKRIASHLYQKIQEEDGDNKKFHLRKLEEDKLKMQQELERRKKILAERKQIYKSIDYSDLENHQRRHQELFNQLTEAKRARRQEKELEIIEKNNKAEPYRGISHDYVIDQIQERQNKKKAPKQRKRKIKEYEECVRQKYLPKTHQPSNRKSDVKINRSSLSHREVKRYRYLNGVAYGQVVENLPKGKSDTEQKQIGNEYLAYLRSLPKKRNSEMMPTQNTLSPEDLQILNKKLNKIVRVKKQRNPLYEGRHSMEVKISSNPTRDEVSMVINQLKTKDQQARMKQKLLRHQNVNSENSSLSQRQINDQIVKNIQQKLNLLAKL